MAELIVSYLITSQHGNPIGRRFYDDGQVEDYRVSKLVKGADGTYKDERVTPGWYPMVKLSTADLKAVQQAVDASGADKMPVTIQGDPKRSTANRQAEWQIKTGGGLKQIRVTDWPAEDQAGQALMTLSSQLGDIASKAVAAR
jgi:hypothetical protein